VTRQRREDCARALERKAVLHGRDMMLAGKPIASVDAYLISAMAVAQATRTGTSIADAIQRVAS
jgi:hypothetical protein